MKKMILVIFLMLAGLGIFAQNTVPGMIRELNGTVELKVPGSSSYVTAKAGDRLTQDTVISTGFKSYALVEVGSTLITVRPLTRLTLAEIRASEGKETLNVNLHAGRLRVEVNPPAGARTSMSVMSPTATASVRGTGFEFDTRNLKVKHGKVSFLGKEGNAMLVGAGFSSTVEGNGKAADPVSERVAGLRPKRPVGSDSSGRGSGVTPAATSGLVTITLNY